MFRSKFFIPRGRPVYVLASRLPIVEYAGLTQSFGIELVVQEIKIAVLRGHTAFH
jgi:hypothetical protein